MRDEVRNILIKLGKYKYPLIVLAVGIGLMLLPTESFSKQTSVQTDSRDEMIAQLLSSAEGMGQTRVLSSQNGVVIVCEGAEKAAVRLDIIRAVVSYTGMSSDKITILKMADMD